MSKRINVNPGNYKVAGRGRQGEDILQTVQRQAYGEQRAEDERWQARQDAVPGWETPAQPVAEPEPEVERTPAKKSRRTPSGRPRKPAAAGRSRKQAARNTPQRRRSTKRVPTARTKSRATARKPKRTPTTKTAKGARRKRGKNAGR